MSGVEFAAGRSREDFPRSWGTPPRDEDQRAAWILAHASAEEARRNPVVALRQLERRYRP